ncbi:MAG: hypothetical protein ACOYOF_06655 [Verrucomicrobiaceae bacterium]
MFYRHLLCTFSLLNVNAGNRFYGCWYLNSKSYLRFKHMGYLSDDTFGRHSAEPAASLKIGDIIVWNIGICNEVIEISSEGKDVIVGLSDARTVRFNAYRAVHVKS